MQVSLLLGTTRRGAGGFDCADNVFRPHIKKKKTSHRRTGIFHLFLPPFLFFGLKEKQFNSISKECNFIHGLASNFKHAHTLTLSQYKQTPSAMWSGLRKKYSFTAGACVLLVCVCVCARRQWKDHGTHLRQMSESDKPPLILVKRPDRSGARNRRTSGGGATIGGERY